MEPALNDGIDRETYNNLLSYLHLGHDDTTPDVIKEYEYMKFKNWVKLKSEGLTGHRPAPKLIPENEL